jgi:predicted dienelactone hydrolase
VFQVSNIIAALHFITTDFNPLSGKEKKMTSNLITRTIITALSSITLFSTAYAREIGIKTIDLPAAHRTEKLQTFVWYPANQGGSDESVGDNALFVGHSALRDAPMEHGKFPLIIFSHGSGGNAPNVAWMASKLAKQGFIVAAPNHPGTTSGDSRPKDTIKVWNRPMDLSAVLTGVLSSTELSAHIDQSNIGLTGFSLGGYAVLAAAGANVDANAYARYCDINNEPISECGWYAKGGVDMHKIDKVKFNQSNIDKRFTAVASIDPAIAQAYVPESIASISIPTLIINLGKLGNIPWGIDGSKIAAAIQGAQYHTVDDAVHYSFLGECKPNGKEILAAEGEADPLCDDGGARARSEIHQELIAKIESFFKKSLAN